MQIHELKTIEPYFSQVYLGLKTFELRLNDRDFKVGDILILREYDVELKQFTGNHVEKTVLNVLENAEHFGLMKGHCILSLGKI